MGGSMDCLSNSHSLFCARTEKSMSVCNRTRPQTKPTRRQSVGHRVEFFFEDGYERGQRHVRFGSTVSRHETPADHQGKSVVVGLLAQHARERRTRVCSQRRRSLPTEPLDRFELEQSEVLRAGTDRVEDVDVGIGFAGENPLEVGFVDGRGARRDSNAGSLGSRGPRLRRR